MDFGHWFVIEFIFASLEIIATYYSFRIINHFKRVDSFEHLSSFNEFDFDFSHIVIDYGRSYLSKNYYFDWYFEYLGEVALWTLDSSSTCVDFLRIKDYDLYPCFETSFDSCLFTNYLLDWQ